MRAGVGTRSYRWINSSSQSRNRSVRNSSPKRRNNSWLAGIVRLFGSATNSALGADEPRLVDRMIELGTAYGRYGYRRTHADRPLKLLTVVDEYSRECLPIPNKHSYPASIEDALSCLATGRPTFGTPTYRNSRTARNALIPRRTE